MGSFQVLHLVKAVSLLLLAFVIFALFAAVELPVFVHLVFNIALWFGVLVAATVVLCTWGYRRRRDVLHIDETLADFLDEMLMNLLGILVAGPIAVVLVTTIVRGPPQPLVLSAFTVGCAIACVWSIVGMYRHLTRA